MTAVKVRNHRRCPPELRGLNGGNRPWAYRAACVGSDPDIWFPDYRAETATHRETRGGGERVRREMDFVPKTICGTCPVVDECLLWAIEHDEVGIWGATNELERRELRRLRRRVAN